MNPAALALMGRDASAGVSLRVRFASRCARSLIAALQKNPLDDDSALALRELADPFVLTEAARVLVPAGRWRELLMFWRADLPCPKALVAIAEHAGLADRLALASALRGRRETSCYPVIAGFLCAEELELRKVAGEALRLALLQTHYRAPLDFTKDGLRRAKAMLDRFYGALRGVEGTSDPQAEPPAALIAALSDDLNTPLALKVLHEAVSDLNAASSAQEKSAARDAVTAAGRLLGVLQQDPEDWFRWRGAGDHAFDDAAVETMIAERAAARTARDFAESDRIRDALADSGVILEDKPDGTIWRRR